MTPHQLVNAVCVRLDSDEFDPALVDLLAAAANGAKLRRLKAAIAAGHTWRVRCVQYGDEWSEHFLTPVEALKVARDRREDTTFDAYVVGVFGPDGVEVADA